MSSVSVNAMSYRPCPRCEGKGELVTANHDRGVVIFFCDGCSKLYSLCFTHGGVLLETKS